MQIRWNNIIVSVLMIVLGVVLVRNFASISATIAGVRNISPYHPDPRVDGLLALGLLCVTCVAIVKLLTTRDDK